MKPVLLPVSYDLAMIFLSFVVSGDRRVHRAVGREPGAQ